MRSTGGEIVQVEGGHIVRSTGRKDRHSKVYTAKGPRDRRVRLSAHTAIEFYDVQDRLGYDRPSKAVDWLIKKAKPSIDKLAELPPWHPTRAETNPEPQEEEEEEQQHNNNALASSNNIMVNHNNHIAEQSESSGGGYGFQLQNHSAFIQQQQQQQPPQHMDNDPIAFFPTNSTTSSMNFQNYPPEIISRTINPAEDLGLSLHSFQQTTGGGGGGGGGVGGGGGGSTNVPFESHYNKIVSNWNNEVAVSSMNMNRVEFTVNPHHQQHPFGTIQSSFSPSLRNSWSDIPIAMNNNASSENHHHHRAQQQIHHHASIFGSRFLSDGLGGYCIPARIQGEEENNNGVASNSTPSSASPNSHH